MIDIDYLKHIKLKTNPFGQRFLGNPDQLLDRWGESGMALVTFLFAVMVMAAAPIIISPAL